MAWGQHRRVPVPQTPKQGSVRRGEQLHGSGRWQNMHTSVQSFAGISTIPGPISGPTWLPEPQMAPGCSSPVPGHPNMRGGGGDRAGAGGHC